MYVFRTEALFFLKTPRNSMKKANLPHFLLAASTLCLSSCVDAPMQPPPGWRPPGGYSYRPSPGGPARYPNYSPSGPGGAAPLGGAGNTLANMKGLPIIGPMFRGQIEQIEKFVTVIGQIQSSAYQREAAEYKVQTARRQGMISSHGPKYVAVKTQTSGSSKPGVILVNTETGKAKNDQIYLTDTLPQSGTMTNIENRDYTVM